MLRLGVPTLVLGCWAEFQSLGVSELRARSAQHVGVGVLALLRPGGQPLAVQSCSWQTGDVPDRVQPAGDAGASGDTAGLSARRTQGRVRRSARHQSHGELECTHQFGTDPERSRDDVEAGDGRRLGMPVHRCGDSLDERAAGGAEFTADDQRRGVEEIAEHGEDAAEGPAGVVQDAPGDVVVRMPEAEQTGFHVGMGVGYLCIEGRDGHDRLQTAAVAAAAHLGVPGQGVCPISPARPSEPRYGWPPTTNPAPIPCDALM